MPKHTTEKLVSSSYYEVITPSDTVNFVINGEERHCRGLYVGTTGNIRAVRPDDTVVTFTAVPAGAILPIVAKRINLTSTTATTIVALF